MNKLYIIPTPIGNLKDITFRAIEVLQFVDIIFAEDTRHAKTLLQHYHIHKPLQSCFSKNEKFRTIQLLQCLREGQNVGLISDAGTPLVSDPGQKIVSSCIANGFNIECLPGPTALIPALVLSGFDTHGFEFVGFMPHKKGRQTLWKQLALSPKTIILYESPHRIIKCLIEIVEYCGRNRGISVSRELTKIYEETTRGTALEVLTYYQNKKAVKGEIVVVISTVNDE